MNFICKWNDSKEKTWSGTCFALENALSSYFEINEVALKINRFEKLIVIVQKLIFKILGQHDFRVLQLHILSKKLQRSLKANKNNVNFMFETYKTEKLENSYIYIDLSVEYLYDRYKKNDDLLKYTPLDPSVSKSELLKRQRISEDYLKSCRGIFTMSKWLEVFMKNTDAALADKVHYVGGGCNIDVSKVYPDNKKNNKFLFVGVDWERKNGDLVLKAFNKLKTIHTNIELYIAGPKEKPFKQDYDSVYFLGNLSFDELVPYYNKCDFFVMPSKFEAYGLVFGEALIYGLPCIAKNCFAMPEFIIHGKNGYLINNDDYLELAEYMERLLVDPNPMVNYVQKNQKYYIEQYSWDTVARKIYNIISQDIIYDGEKDFC